MKTCCNAGCYHSRILGLLIEFDIVHSIIQQTTCFFINDYLYVNPSHATLPIEILYLDTTLFTCGAGYEHCLLIYIISNKLAICWDDWNCQGSCNDNIIFSGNILKGRCNHNTFIGVFQRKVAIWITVPKQEAYLYKVNLSFQHSIQAVYKILRMDNEYLSVRGDAFFKLQ